MRIDHVNNINTNLTSSVSQDTNNSANIVKVQQNLNPVDREKPSEKVDVEDLLKDIEKSIDKIKMIFRGEAQFILDRELNMIIIKIKDRETGEIIRQIPPEVAVKIAKNLQELMGILFDERV